MTQFADNTQRQDPTFVELLPQGPLPGSWQPVIGRETHDLARDILPAQSRNSIVREAADVLSRCHPPSEQDGQKTGLVVGYVQSGKTMSFTTLAALASDNGYRMIIVVAGVSIPLLEQSRFRLLNDLRLNDRNRRCPWRHVPDPSLDKRSDISVRDVLAEWNDRDVPATERRTVLITVMKQHLHLSKLIQVLRRLDLRGVPTVIIDDEGDQAGLNTMVRQGSESTTYRRLLEVKDALPHHSYLQYTATPQAPLLINLVDILSPNFAEVITPGPGYTGGREFFTGEPNLVRPIPANDIPSPNNQLVEPPQSLLRAMRLFFLGATVHIVTNDLAPNRSMMVHPSQRVLQHGRYFNWVSNAMEQWKRLLSLPDSDPARSELIELFRSDYADLQRTAADLPSFDALTPRIRHALLRTTPREINATPRGGGPVNWNETWYWILVGGKALDRGFTVEGLTVTYMPRGPGLGNADTIQQRGRFFGYKQGYQAFCRIFLERAIEDAFRTYVEHEEDIRSQLLAHRATGRPMSDWRRQFFLNRNLRPTRNSVIDIPYNRGDFDNKWVYPEGPHDSPEVVHANRDVFESFKSRLVFVQHGGLDRRATENKNMVVENVKLNHLHSEFLTRWRVRRIDDSQTMAALLRLIQLHLNDHPDDECTLVLMSGGQLIRRGYENDKIKELFQGVQYDAEGETYPGDRAIRGEDNLTVQLRNLTLGERSQPPIAENIPHFAVWVPSRISRDLIQQPQGGGL
jgi:hypothetical protein